MIKLIDFLNLFDDDSIIFDIVLLVENKKAFDDLQAECLVSIDRNYKGNLIYYYVGNVYILNKNRIHVVMKGVFNVG